MLSRLKECCFPRKSSRRSSATFRKNKVSPEISLKSWFDFVETAKDPTGTKGKIMPVTEDILTQHSSDNYWLALRGSVYCVADFINFHPGGKERILMGVGHDASMLFNIYHAHIDFETILHRCYVGPFVRDTGKDYINSLQPSSATSISGSEPQMPASLSCTWSQDKIMLVFTVHHSGEALVGTVLSIFASPLLCRFRMFSRKKAAAIQWTFPDAVISTEAYVEHCKTDSSMVIFPKVERTTWNLRSISSTHLSFEEYGFKSCTVGAVSIVAQNVLRFDVEIEPSAAVSIPMGSHMVWKLGELNLLRCYSPVPSEMQLVDLGRFVNKLTFMIKLYPDSASSKYIGQLKAGKVVEVSDPLPSLTLNTQRLIESTQVTLISGGTGINPFPRLVLSLLKSTSASIDLVAFFRKLQDVFWRDELLQLSSSFPNRLRVSFVLDEADPKWTSYCGGLNSDILARLLPTFSEMACACVCGKEGFCDMVKRYLNELGWYEDAITTL